MKIRSKHIFYAIFSILVLGFLCFLTYNIVKREKYRTLRTVGLFPIGLDKKTIKDRVYPQEHKYSGHSYLRHRRRYNFLAQRNAGQRQ